MIFVLSVRSRSLLMALICFLNWGISSADVLSTSDIKFDINNDGVGEMKLNSTGLRIGSSGNPSANLHVSGNSIVTTNITIGSSTLGSSNLHLNGTIGYSIETISSGNFVSGSNTVIISSPTSANLHVVMPNVADVEGRVFMIKHPSSSTNLNLINGPFNDSFGLQLGSSSLFPSVKLLATSTSYQILQQRGVTEYEPVASDNLALWLRFEEANGATTIVDSTSSANNGSMGAGTYASATGVFGNAVTMDGDDYITLGDVFNYTDNFTLSCWIKSTNTSTTRIAYKRNGGSGGWDWFKGTLVKFYLPVHNQTKQDATSNPSDGYWHHIAFVFDYPSLKQYFDGDLKQTHTISGTVVPVSTDFQIGYPNNYIGEIDDLRVYDKPLSDAEIDLIHASGNLEQ